MPAEPNLIAFAQRVAEDVPEEHAVSIDVMEEQTSFTECTSNEYNDELGINFPPIDEVLLHVPFDLDGSPLNENTSSPDITNGIYPSLSDTYNMTIDFFGRFKQQIIQPTILNSST